MNDLDETKQCPYCGETIAATAKKCKHCGEWLNEEIKTPTAPLVNHSSEKEEVEHLESPIKSYASWLSFGGIFCRLNLLLYAIGIENIIPGKWGRALQDPEWFSFIGVIFYIVDIILLYGLLRGLKGHSKPMRKSLSIYIISYIAFLIVALAGDETITAVMEFGVCVVMQSIIGIRLLIHYRGNLATLGVCMVCFAVLSLINSESVILEIISFVVNFFYFGILSLLLSKEEEEKKEEA